jgi:DNA mismatch repair ATPase MutS
MSGKSFILRQTALIVLLAGMGSLFLPKAYVWGVDKDFYKSRTGDNISMESLHLWSK